MTAFILILFCIVALALGLALGRRAHLRWPKTMPRWMPAAVLVPGLLPLSWHFRSISDFIAPVTGVIDRSGAAGELEALALGLPFAILALWGIAILITRRLPAFAAFFPALATLFYLVGAAQAAPLVGEVIAARGDWHDLLIAAQVPATLAVCGFLWGALGRARVFASWALRQR
ncbi:hypothetical protein [Novosphingobium mathurense]|uniref:Uncharacterized protein n=1 Tax=Novosphingobium mathurense TaxID=428990 RepID=A0A1U6GU75_9SPHN|nr:hypothetical protein [Novosphingobium mathurense]SLJ87044.1 hypothetical protein SAMN06295987_101463 [Novosphingobium mathurense]